MKKLKEELTTKMHSEFTVDRATDLIHKSESAALAVNAGMNRERAAKAYGVTEQQIVDQQVNLLK